MDRDTSRQVKIFGLTVSLRQLLIIGAAMLVTLIVLSVVGISLYGGGKVIPFTPKQDNGPSSVELPIRCATPHHAPGEATLTIQSGGITRSFLVHLAPSYGHHPQPLVINYHGYSWTSRTMEQTSHMDSVADQAGFVLVFPQGAESPPSWNAGNGAYGPTGDYDDIQFTRDLLSYMESNYCINTERVYVTGFSLGGGMAYRVACSLSQQITAVATVSGAYYPIPDGCHLTRPVPVLEIHGVIDKLAPYNGNTATRMAAVQDYLNGWLDRDKCDHSSKTFFQQEDVTGIEWTHCAPGVVVRHYRISDNGHTWPGSPNTTHVIDGSQVIWQFFSQFKLPIVSPAKH